MSTSIWSKTQKRPRAETQTRNSPESTRIRLIEEPDLDFTLFDQAEVATIDIAALDSQLSDSSDASDDEAEVVGMIFPDSPVSDDEASDGPPLDPGSPVTESPGDWAGTRTARRNYRLTSNEDLSGPDLSGSDLQPTPLANEEKAVLKKFCKYLIEHWPSQHLNSELANSRRLVFVDPTGFWYGLFHAEFKKFLDLVQSTPNQSHPVGVFL